MSEAPGRSSSWTVGGIAKVELPFGCPTLPSCHCADTRTTRHRLALQCRDAQGSPSPSLKRAVIGEPAPASSVPCVGVASTQGWPMSQFQRLVAAQDGCCFFCGKRLSPRTGAVVRLPGAAKARGDSSSLACCRRTAEKLALFEPKDQLVALLNPKQNSLCAPETDMSDAKGWSGPGLPPNQTPKANADFCPPRPVALEQIRARSQIASSEGRPLLFSRCTVCDAPAIPGDSLCYTHNR